MKRPKKYRLFYKYLLSYIIILLIPLLVMYFYVYTDFINILKNEVIERNYDMMVKIKNTVDMHLSSIKEVPVQIYDNKLFRPYYINNDKINVIEASEDLSNFAVTNELIYELLFYVREDKYLYSSSGSRTISTFINTIYNYENWQYENFYETINNIKKPLLRPEETVLINNQNKYSFITYLHPLPTHISNPYATVIFLIDAVKMKDLIKNVLTNREGNTIILDEYDNIVTSLKNESYLKGSDFKQVIHNSETSKTETTMINNKEYLISSVTSNKTGWTYVTLIPVKSIMGKVLNIRKKIIYGTLFILIAGSIFIYSFMYINYNPIKMLKKYTEKNIQKNIKDTNEIEYIHNAIANLSETSTLLTKKIKNSKPALKEYLLTQVLKNNIKTIEEFNKKGKDINLGYTKPNFRVLVIALEPLEKMDKKITISRLIYDVEKVLPEKIEGYGKLSMEKNKIIFILATEEMSYSMLEPHLLYVKRYIKKEMKLQTTIGVGNQSNSISLTGKSFIEATTALDYRLVKGNNKIIFFNEITPQLTNMDYYPKAKLDQLELSLIQGETEKIKNVITEIIELIKNNNTPLFWARCLSYEIINTVMKVMYETNYQWDTDQDEKFNILSLTQFDTVEELAIIIEDISKEICSYINQDKEGYNQDLMNSLITYIKDKYTDYNFSIQQMADYFDMSASNLSHHFKKQTGQNISDYVNHLRINKAKELLKTSDYYVKEIVSKVGYCDDSSFIRKFKQIVGVTPGKYRKM